MVMRDQQNRKLIFCGQLADQLNRVNPGLHIQRRERLIKQQKRGFSDQGPGQPHALGLTARQLARKAGRQMGNAQPLQRDVNQLLVRGADTACRRQCQFNGFPAGQMIKQIAVLKQKAERALPDRQIQQVTIIPTGLAARLCLLITSQNVQQCCLAYPGWPVNGQDIPALHAEAEGVNRTAAAAKPQISNFQHEPSLQPACLPPDAGRKTNQGHK